MTLHFTEQLISAKQVPFLPESCVWVQRKIRVLPDLLDSIFPTAVSCESAVSGSGERVGVAKLKRIVSLQMRVQRCNKSNMLDDIAFIAGVLAMVVGHVRCQLLMYGRCMNFA
jgi:hypothetical protein